MGKKHIPIIVGAAHFTQRKGTPQLLDIDRNIVISME